MSLTIFRTRLRAPNESLALEGMRITDSDLTGHWHRAALASIVMTLLVGCGGGGYADPPVVPVSPVSGKVTFDSKIPAGAEVTLIRVDKTEEAVAGSHGTVKEDGTFKISTYGDGDGAPPGDYVAVVQWFKVVSNDGGTGRGPNVIPAKFSNPETSPIKVTVKDGANEIPPIAIPRS